MRRPYSALSHLECARCGAVHDAAVVQGLCGCGSPLLARYDLAKAAALADRAEIGRRPADLWRYHELLPVSGAGRVVSLGEGMTPLLAMPRLGRALGVPRLLMKDESLIPTGTFKARGAAVGVSRAAELGVAGVAMATNGNAGAAWAAYAARAGLPSFVVMAADAPAVNRAECRAFGAELRVADGSIADAARLVAAEVPARPGYQDVSTLKEPYRIEGKKTMGLEIAEQLGWRLPDVIVYPTGGGVGIIGIHKALLELRELGWTGQQPLPRLVAVQSTGCAPIVRAFAAGADHSEPWPDPRTVAFGITVPKALGDFLVLERALRHRGDRHRRGRHGAARRSAPGRAPGRQLHLPRGRGLRHRGAAAPRIRLAGRSGPGGRAEYRHRAEVPAHHAARRAGARALTATAAHAH